MLVNSAVERFSESDIDISKAGGSNDIVLYSGWSKNKIQYNQNIVDYRFCVPTAALTNISNYWGITLTDAQLLGAVPYAKKYGWVSGQGMYVDKGADAMVEYWNTLYPQYAVHKYFVTVGGAEDILYRSKGFLTMTGFTVDNDFLSDVSDGNIDNYVMGNKLYGHCINTSHGGIVDNYKGVHTYNTYSGDINKFMEVFGFKGGYIFLPNNPIIQMNTIPVLSTTDAEDLEIIKAFKQEVSNEVALKSFKIYTDKRGIEKMLIVLNKVRNSQG